MPRVLACLAMDEVNSRAIKENPPRATGTGTVKLPPGMTQEEADRLVAEADRSSKENS